MRCILRRLKGESGTTLVEVLVAMAILGLIAAAFLSAMATSSRAAVTDNEQATAESLARSQMEYAMDMPYAAAPASYALDSGLAVPASWTVSPAQAQAVHASDDGIQQLTVSVQRNGRMILSLTSYKMNR